MNILNKLTIKSLVLNKKRTMVTIIGIILSCALICGVATLAVSFKQAFINRAKITDGNYHVIFKSVPKNEQKYIANNIGVKKYMLTQDIGYAKLEGSKNEDKPYVFLKEFDDNALNNMGLNLVSGRFPKNSNEIVISEHIITNGGVNLKIGDKITLDISKRLSNGYELNQDSPYNINENVNEYLEKLYTKEYTIVGVIQRLSSESYVAPGYTIISHLDTVGEKSNIAVLLKNVKDVYNFKKSIVGSDDDTLKYQYKYNNELLKFEGVSQNDNINATLYTVSSIVIAIIIISSVFVIRNSISISITERIKQYGILSSIGATSKQIKKNVLYEGFLLSIVAIPIGIGVGIGAIGIVLSIVNNILKDYLGNLKLALYVSPVSITIAILISLFTIFISIIIPAIKASKISPIEAIRETNDVKIESKKLKVSKLFSKIFGIEGEIALKNFKRSKKKYRTTILSIFISVVLFITLDSFAEYTFKESKLYYDKINYNITVSDRIHEKNKDKLNYYDKVSKLENINQYSIEKQISAVVNNNDVTEKAKLLYNSIYAGTDTYSEKTALSINVVAVGQKQYSEYISKLGGKIEDYENKGILINKNISSVKGKKYEYNFLNVNEKDKLKLLIYDSNLKKDRNIEIEIAKITDIAPMEIHTSDITETAYLIVSDKYIENLDYSVGSMYIDSSNPDKLEEDIKQIDSTMKNSVYNMEDAKREENATSLAISIFLYGFIIIISLIGITNIFNTITTNIALRKNEFAVLRSIGMTDKEFTKMINFESLFYGIKSLLYGLPVGIIFSYMIYKGYSNMLSTTYMLPYKAIIISIVFVFLIITWTMHYSIKKIKRQNIIDTIRNENI